MWFKGKKEHAIPLKDRLTGGPLHRLRLHFVGEVQAVGFRWNSARVAGDLNLTGWVRNEDDGSVRAEIQGTESHVGAFFSQMLEAYRHHPISYVVEEREEIPVDPAEHEFRIIYY